MKLNTVDIKNIEHPQQPTKLTEFFFHPMRSLTKGKPNYGWILIYIYF